jgi:GTP-binding protein HflX
MLVKDMVFATLDTKMGSIKMSDNKKVIISDTVGFISALPTELIDSFKSSLEELFSSDYLLLVHDLSNANIENQAKLVFDTLISIGFTEEELEKKIINVFNKCDLNSDLSNIKINFKKNSVKTSALTSNGIKDLKNYIENLAEKKLMKVLFHIPTDSYKISSWLHKNSYVYNETFSDIDFIGNKVKAKISNDKLNSFKSHFPEIELYTI